MKPAMIGIYGVAAAMVGFFLGREIPPSSPGLFHELVWLVTLLVVAGVGIILGSGERIRT